VAIHLKNIHISNCKGGIKIDGPADIVADNVTFDNVERPWDVSGVCLADVRGTRIKNDPKRTRKGKTASIGWTKTNGPPLLAFCPECKTVFSSANYNFGGSIFNAWNNEETCPECGNEHALLSEGLFDLTQETVRVLSAPDFTHAMLQDAKRIADEVIAGSLDEAEAVCQFESISPEFKKLLEKAPGFLYKSAMLVATVICAYYAYAAYDNPKQQPQTPAAITTATNNVLKEMGNKIITSSGVRNKAYPNGHLSAATDLTKSKSAFKTETSDVRIESKPKARHMRRKAEKERRRSGEGPFAEILPSDSL
jgi:hypothetical protein